jgi:hypothetical protein
MLSVWNNVESVIRGGQLFNMALITGCPGVGKSTEVFCQLVYHATNPALEQRLNCIWIHSNWGNDVVMLVVVNGRAYSCKFGDGPNGTTVMKEVVYWCIHAKIDIIGLDGTWTDPLKFACSIREGAVNANDRVAIIQCTSEQNVNVSQSQFALCPYNIFHVAGWERGDLEAAYDKGLLVFPTPDLNFGDMYFYAGGAIRLYGLQLSKLKTFLDSKIQEICDMKAALIGNVGSASKHAVNSLQCIYRSNDEEDQRSKWIISQYVAHCVLKKANCQLLERFYDITQGNKSFRGWVLEGDVLGRVHRKQPFGLLDTTGEVKFTIDPEKSVLYPSSASPSCIKDLQVGESLFVYSTRYNQALWDGIVVEKTNNDNNFKIIFLQVTCDPAHEFKCGNVASLLGWLFPSNLEHRGLLHCGEIWFYTVVEMVKDITIFKAIPIEDSTLKLYDPGFNFGERTRVYALYSNHCH